MGRETGRVKGDREGEGRKGETGRVKGERGRKGGIHVETTERGVSK